jgi:predicted transcriptional regulator
MTPLEELARDMREESRRTGRKVREMLDVLRDEGMIECTDDEFERCVKLAEGH